MVVGFLVLAIAPAPGANAAENDDLTWTVTLDDRRVDRVDSAAPLKLGGEQPTRVELEVTNTGDKPMLVNTLRLEGRVLGMAFFSYSVRLDLELEPNTAVDRSVDLYLDGLTDQAVGVLPARLQLLDEERQPLVEEAFPVEVQGSLWSTYGWFGLAVAASTALLVSALLLAIARTGKPGAVGLSENRWVRGLQFAAPGLGLGLTVTFTLSATGLLVPSIGAWLPTVLIFAGAAFALGYFLPFGLGGPRDENVEPGRAADELSTTSG